MKKIKFSKLSVNINGSKIKINYFHRAGKKGTIIFVHGLGCLKEDFIKAAKVKELKDFELLAFDWPGAGESPYPKNKTLSIDDLVQIINDIAVKFSLKRFILVGHSIGGVAALFYAAKYPKRVVGFVNVEGSLVSRNARWSREIKKMGLDVFRDKPFQQMKTNLKKHEKLGFRRYAKTLDSVSIKSYFDFSVSHAKICKNEYLLKKFLGLKIPKVFIYGSENKSWLTIAKKLNENYCRVMVIPQAHHFPFIDNPAVFYKVLAKFAEDLFVVHHIDR